MFMPFLKPRMPQTRTVLGFRLGRDLPRVAQICLYSFYVSWRVCVCFGEQYRRRGGMVSRGHNEYYVDGGLFQRFTMSRP